MNYSIRKTNEHDEPVLKEMLYYAIHVPAGSPLPPESIVELPALSSYYKSWGKSGDSGYLAFSENTLIAGVWLRLFEEQYPGYGFVKPGVPELSMAVKDTFRNQGIGTHLLETLFHDPEITAYKAVSLSVHKTNRAVHLYKRFDFEILSEDEESFLMIRKI